MSNETLDAGAIEAVRALAVDAAGKKVMIGGLEYSTTPLHDPRKPETEPKSLSLHTLSALAAYVNEQDGGYYDEVGHYLHVADPVTVFVCTGIFGAFNQRAFPARADAYVPRLQFGQFEDSETFNIHMQSLFVDDASTDRAKVLALVGNIQSGATQTAEDDGTTQVVTARRGINRVANVQVPNPVVLRPFRTFSEVTQPASEFILRMRGGSPDSLPTCALFEADGGAWRLTAVKAIQAWLAERVKVPVYA